MGLLGDAIKKLQGDAGSRASHPRAPDLDALVSESEIEEVTGAAPAGEPRRNGPEGMEVDLGRLVIRESKLANGDEFLVSLGNWTDPAASKLAMDRMAEVEKPLDGVGERGLIRVKKYPKKGVAEIGVTALKGRFTLSLTHTSTSGESDPGPLTDLLKKALGRL